MKRWISSVLVALAGISLAQTAPQILGLGTVSSFTVSRDGKLAATGGGRGVILWDAETQQVSRIFDGHNAPVTSLAFSPNNQMLASGDEAGGVRVWDLTAGRLLATLRGHESYVNDLVFSPNSVQLATGADDSTLRIWEARTGRLARTVQTEESVLTLAYSTDGRNLAAGMTGDADNLKVFDPTNGRELQNLKGHTDWVRGVAYSANGQFLASVSDDQTVKLWEVRTGRLVRTLQGHEDWVMSVIFSPDSRTLASGADDGQILLWDVATGRQTSKLEDEYGYGVYRMYYTPAGNGLYTLMEDGIMMVWALANRSSTEVFLGHTQSVVVSGLSPSGKVLVTGASGGQVLFWDLDTGRQIASALEHGTVQVLQFSPDGNTVATADEDGLIVLWEVSTGRSLMTFEEHEDSVNALAFSQDGTRLASASSDGAIIIWDVSNGRPLTTLRGHLAPVTALVFAGNRIISSSNDGTSRIWTLP